MKDIGVRVKQEAEGKEYLEFTHLPTDTVVAGWCQTFTKKDEYRLLNALLDLVKEIQNED